MLDYADCISPGSVQSKESCIKKNELKLVLFFVK